MSENKEPEQEKIDSSGDAKSDAVRIAEHQAWGKKLAQSMADNLNANVLGRLASTDPADRPIVSDD